MKIFSLLVLGILLIGVASAITCCERTTTEAWCQNANSETECNTGINPVNGEPYRVINAFCDATSYCRPGTCINNRDGICMPNTAEIVCESNNGFWSDKPKAEIAQCKLGCCVLGDSTAFVTQVACNRMSSLYGLTINYRADITTELECLASSNPSAKGACVYEKELARTCEMTTRKECNDKKKSSTLSGIEFHEGFLCSANELETVCAKSQSTRCEGDDIYFIDTCGNLANIYDSDKINDQTYWTLVQEPICSDGNGNKNSASCGDCDYYSGSMCKQKGVGEIVDYGNYICKDLDCNSYSGYYPGTGKPKHGESWCATDTATGIADKYLPGSTQYRLLCYNGEVTTEICDTTRQKICSEVIVDTDTGFRTGNCRANKWQDCTAQTTEVSCSDTDFRDCEWKSGYHFDVDTGLQTGGEGYCVPKYPPGFERNGNDNLIGGESCAQASSVCFVKVEKGLTGGGWTCDSSNPGNNCSCLDSSSSAANPAWVKARNDICVRLGDCGDKTNFIGKAGNTENAITEIIELGTG